MNTKRVGASAALGMFVTFALIILMYKLIDSGNKDLTLVEDPPKTME